MYSVGVNSRQYNYNTTERVKTSAVKKTSAQPEGASCSYVSNPIINTIPFNHSFTASALRTRMNSQEEKNKYNTILSNLDKTSKKQMKELLKSGILLNSNSNDKSTVLDNLYKIATKERANGLPKEIILKDTITTLADPHVITQQFGDIPKEMKSELIDTYMSDHKMDKDKLIPRKLAQLDIDVEHSGTCVASSIEFNLAKKMPSEFARFVEGITSPRMAVDKTIQLKNLTDNTLDSIWLLNAFEVPYKMDDFNQAHLTFAPDKNAYIRAKIQVANRDGNERSVVDALMQGTLMQIGSQQTYDSLSDKRKGKFNQNDKGLIEFEKTFTESVVEDKNKISVTYQTVDDNARLIGYETDFDTMKRQISDALKLGENVIIGYTQINPDNEIINGHEITIIGEKYDKDGNLIYICNDTDDDIPNAVEYSAEYLLPKIHHAGLPQEVVKDDVKLVENWVEGFNSFNQMRKKAAEQQNEKNAA